MEITIEWWWWVIALIVAPFVHGFIKDMIGDHSEIDLLTIIAYLCGWGLAFGLIIGKIF